MLFKKSNTPFLSRPSMADSSGSDAINPITQWCIIILHPHHHISKIILSYSHIIILPHPITSMWYIIILLAQSLSQLSLVRIYFSSTPSPPIATHNIILSIFRNSVICNAFEQKIWGISYIPELSAHKSKNVGQVC